MSLPLRWMVFTSTPTLGYSFQMVKNSRLCAYMGYFFSFLDRVFSQFKTHAIVIIPLFVLNEIDRFTQSSFDLLKIYKYIILWSTVRSFVKIVHLKTVKCGSATFPLVYVNRKLKSWPWWLQSSNQIFRLNNFKDFPKKSLMYF